MSIELMTKAFKARVGNQTRKLILIKIADNADDSGRCFPSYQAIADACEVERRSVIRHVKDMVEMGLLSVQKRFVDGENSSNIFTINIVKLNEMGSVTKSLPQCQAVTPLVTESHPPSDSLSPPLVTESHPESSIFNHQLTIIEPSIGFSASAQPTPAKKSVVAKPEFAQKPETVMPDLWAEWLHIRKVKKHAPPTERAMQSMNEEAGKAGLTIKQAITECCDRGWAGFKADWYENAKATISKQAQQNQTFDQSGNLAAMRQPTPQPQSKMLQGVAALQAMKSTNRGAQA